MVTDLDAHLTQRALASLSAELTRRERVLAAAGAKDIEEYTERGSLQPRYRPLPGWPVIRELVPFSSIELDLFARADPCQARPVATNPGRVM